MKKDDAPYKKGDKVLTTIGRRKGKRAYVVDYYYNMYDNIKRKGWVFLVRFSNYENGYSEIYESQIICKV